MVGPQNSCSNVDSANRDHAATATIRSFKAMIDGKLSLWRNAVISACPYRGSPTIDLMPAFMAVWMSCSSDLFKVGR